MLQAVKHGNWVTQERIRGYSLILLMAYVLATGALVAFSKGGLDPMGRPVGTDFSKVWSAGSLVLDGRAYEAYEPRLHYARQQETFDDPHVPYYAWHSPPFFLLVAAVLAMLPYQGALLVWMSATFPLYALSIQRVVPGRTALLATLAFPAVLINLGHGQNGFLNAALFASALLALRSQPIVAGILFGLLAYKPQLGVLIPVALAVSLNWRAFASASATVIALGLVTIAVFGIDIWQAFLASTHFTRTVALETGNISWEKMQTMFAAVRMLGGSISVAYMAQALLATGLIVAIAWLWHSAAKFELKAAGLCAASILFTPYALDYDMMAMAPGIAFFVAHGLKTGFGPWEKTLLFITWVSPFFARAVAQFTFLPFGLLAMLTLFGLILHRAVHDLAQRSNITGAPENAAI